MKLISSTLLLLFSTLLLLFIPQLVNGEEGTQLKGAFGATMIGGEMYYELKLQPEIRFGRLGIGVDATLHWNEDKGIREEDWNNIDDVAEVVRYIKWSQKGAKPVYFRLGYLDEATLGYGFVMNNYSNQIRDEDDSFKKVLGIELDLNFARWGVETIVNDVTDPQLYGGRWHFKPFEGIKFARKIEVGLSFIRDARDSLEVFGGDIGLPLLGKSLVLYYDYAKINDYGEGYEYGVQGRYELIPGRIQYKLAFRETGSEFDPYLFDALYEIQRPIDLKEYEETRGWWGEILAGRENMFSLRIGYERFEKRDDTLWANLILDPTLLYLITKRRMSASASYLQKNMKKIELENENTLITGVLEYALSENVSLIYSIRQSYKREQGKLRKIRTSSLTTSIIF